jgi:glycosyltransferase involved in cell wall biosynthesis
MSKDKPKIAVIVSNYNYGDYVMSAIKSAQEQDYDGELRIFVVDDGSSDSSWEKISSITDDKGSTQIDEPYYSGPVEFRSAENIFAYRTKNSGASTARNVAIWMAWDWADVFAILDADDEYYKTKISTLCDKLMEYDEVGAVYADYDIHRTYNDVDYMKYESKYPYCKMSLQTQCIVHSGSLVKKGALMATMLKEKKEFFDSRLHGPGSQGFIGCTEDYDLWLRVAEVCMIVHVPKSLSYVRETGQNQSLKMTPEIFEQNAATIRSR